jgi:hypothetical protein
LAPILTRRSILLGVSASSLFATDALACHRYVSPVDGRVGCGGYTRDQNNGVSGDSGSTSTVSQPSSSGSTSTVSQPSSTDTGTSSRTIRVSDSSQLRSALANAGPGTHVELANGTYSGSFTLSNSGNASSPIVIKAANRHGATLTGLLTVDGHHCWVSELMFKPGYMVVRGSDTKVLRCKFIDVRANSITVHPPSQRAEIAYNEFRNYGATGQRAGSGRGVSVRPNSTSRWSAQTHIHRNYFRDQNGDGGTIGIGIAKNNSATGINALVEWNLIENARAQAVYLKSSDNIVRFNTVRQINYSNRSGFQSRHGYRNDFIANASINTGGVLVRGEAHRAIGNYKDNARSGGWFDHGAPTGNVTQDRFMSTSGTHPSGAKCVFIGNIGSMRIGGGSSSDTVPASDTLIEDHSGPIRLEGSRQVGTQDNRNASASVSVPKYQILNPGDVGPDA